MERRVLVVDDSATVRRVVAAVLGESGFAVVGAADGAEGLERVQRERFDLALVDFVMPRLNGFQFAQAIRSLASIRDLPIVLLSARAEAIAERFLASTGAVGWLAKPFSPGSLREAVARALAGPAGRAVEAVGLDGGQRGFEATDGAPWSNSRADHHSVPRAAERVREQLAQAILPTVSAILAKPPVGDREELSAAIRAGLSDAVLAEVLRAVTEGGSAPLRPTEET